MNEELPTVVAEGVLKLPGIRVPVKQLSDGRRVIPPEGVEAVMNWLGAGHSKEEVERAIGDAVLNDPPGGEV